MAESKKKELYLALIIAISASFLLCGYEFLRSSSNVLFQHAYGTENLSLVMALVLPAVFVAMYVYGWLISTIGPRRTLLLVSGVAGLGIVTCYAAIDNGSKVATGALYLVREVYIILVLEQYWSFINSSLNLNSAKKLNGLITGIASLGAISGGLLLHQLSVPLGTINMLLFAAASLFPAALSADIAYRFAKRHNLLRDESLVSSLPTVGSPPTPSRSHLALGLFRQSRTLLGLFVVIVSTQIISTVLVLDFQSTLQLNFPDNDQQTAFSGAFYAGLNGLAAFFQFVASPLLLRFVSLTVIHSIIPLIHVVTVSILFLSPSLFTSSLAYLVFKAFDYSIFRAAKEIFYVPLSFDARFRAKEVIDFFGYRLSKGSTSMVVAILQKSGFAMASVYSVIALSASLLWLLTIAPICRDHKKTLSTHDPDC